MQHEKALGRALATSGIAIAAANFSGHWVNELHSSMELTIDGNSVSGTYTSKVSSNENGGPVSGPVIGYVAGDVIAFSVLWPGSTASITSWVGQIVTENGDQTLNALWHLIVNVPNAEDPNSIWTTIHAGADIFRR
jgi:Avidin family